MQTFLLVILLFVCTVYTKPYKRSAVSTGESYHGDQTDFIALHHAIGSSSSDVSSSDESDSSSDDHGRHGNNEVAHGHDGHKEAGHKKIGKRPKRSTQGGDIGINEATFAILCSGDDWDSVDCSSSQSSNSESSSSDE